MIGAWSSKERVRFQYEGCGGVIRKVESVASALGVQWLLEAIHVFGRRSYCTVLEVKASIPLGNGLTVIVERMFTGCCDISLAYSCGNYAYGWLYAMVVEPVH